MACGQGERGLTLAVRQVAHAGTHQLGHHGSVVDHEREHHRPIRGAGQTCEGEPAPEEDHEQQNGDGSCEFHDRAGNGTDQQARQQSAHTKDQAEHHGSDHGQYGRADRGPQSRQIEVGPCFGVKRRLPQFPAQLVLAVRRIVQTHEDQHDHHREDDACDPIDDTDGFAALRTRLVEQHRAFIACHVASPPHRELVG